MTFTSLNKSKFIELDPSGPILFDDIPNKSSIAYVKIKNVSAGHVLFKIKTTAPRTYVVRPNQVVLSPGESVEVQFCMNPSDLYPSVVNNKDKFMIMATDVSNDPQNIYRQDVWSERPPESIQQFKIGTTFKASQPNTIFQTPNNNNPLGNSLVFSNEQRNEHQKLSPSPIKLNLSREIELEAPLSTDSLNTLQVPENRKSPEPRIASEPRLTTEPRHLTESKIEPRRLTDSRLMTDPKLMTESRLASESKFVNEPKYGQREALYNYNPYNPYNSSVNKSDYVGQTNQEYRNSHPVQGMGSTLSAKSFTIPSAVLDPAVDFKREYERLLSKVEEQEKQLLKVSEERNHVFQELSSVKENLNKRRSPAKTNPLGNDHVGFQLVHVILVAVISLLLGIFLSVH